jgi:UDP-glucose 4-epimerase
VRVVVTGGAGRIGRPTVNELYEAGHEVTVFEIAPPGQPLPPRVTLRLGTVDDCGSVMTVLRQARAEAVVHLARASTNHDDLTVFRSNLMGTYNVLQAAVTCGLGVALVASSIQALGDYWSLLAAPQYLPLDEDHPVAPRTSYATAKALIEETCRAITREHGLTTVAIRPTAVIVPERWPDLLARLSDASDASPGTPPLAGGLLAAYVDARDVAQLIRRALERALAGDLSGSHVFHASGPDPLLAETLAASLARARPEIADLASRLTAGVPGVSIERARALLGYEPRHRWRDMQ